MTAKTIDAGKHTIDITRLSKRAQELVKLAVYFGWAARNTAGRGVLLTSPIDRGQTINMPATTNIQERRAKGWSEKITRYGDPLKVAAGLAHLEDLERTDALGGKRHMSLDDVAAVAQQDPERFEAPAPPTPEVVSERPWLARKGTTAREGRFYESNAVVERRWSDGTIDYACVKPGCDYSNPQPRAVATHYGRSKDHPKAEIPTEVLRKEPWVPAHRPQAERAARLAAQIQQAMEAVGSIGQFDSMGSYAAALAEKLVADRDARRDVDDAERGPLTPEQILDRIRGLVDQGQYLARLEEVRDLEQRAAELELELEAQRVNCEKERATADRLRSEFRALGDIVRNLEGDGE